MQSAPINGMIDLLIALTKGDRKKAGKIQHHMFSPKVIEYLDDGKNYSDDSRPRVSPLDYDTFITAAVNDYIEMLPKTGFFSFLRAAEFVISENGQQLVTAHYKRIEEKDKNKQSIL